MLLYFALLFLYSYSSLPYLLGRKGGLIIATQAPLPYSAGYTYSVARLTCTRILCINIAWVLRLRLADNGNRAIGSKGILCHRLAIWPVTLFCEMYCIIYR